MLDQLYELGRLSDVFAVFFVALSLSLIVERSIELVKNILDFFIDMPGDSIDPTVSRIKEDIQEVKQMLKYNSKELDAESKHKPIFEIAPANDPDDGKVLRTFIIQIFGLLVGILMARFVDLKFFSTIIKYMTIPVQVDYILTGLLIGGGSAPIHVLITFITDRESVLIKKK